jgi:hypothetical protein
MKTRFTMGRRFSLKIVDDTLKKVFFKLGVRIGTTPGYFIIVPLLLTVLCASGFQQLEVIILEHYQDGEHYDHEKNE